ncbi:MAG TPA: hypothetical protein VMW20_02950 [Candidatus Nanoarchaeia archaeon]|nr:hypothetical protein [Candidatus Nanoarchaeia archaeon]
MFIDENLNFQFAMSNVMPASAIADIVREGNYRSVESLENISNKWYYWATHSNMAKIF